MITLTAEQAAEIDRLLSKLHTALDNILYRNYGNQHADEEMKAIEKAQEWLIDR